MRDAQKIDLVMDKIKFIWKHYPNLRLGQLFANTLNFLGMCNVEDDQLLEILSKYYKVNLNDFKPEVKEEINTLVNNMKNVGALNKGKIYIHKGQDVKLIAKEDLSTYTSLGYALGRKDK